MTVFDEIIKGGTRIRAPKGQTLLEKGEYFQQVYILDSGVIKICETKDNNKTNILHILEPKALVPFAFFSGPVLTQWRYVTHTECYVYSRNYDELRQQLEQNGVLAVELSSWFSLQVHELLIKLSAFGKSTTQEKIIATLKFLATHHTNMKDKNWGQVRFPINYQIISDMAGVTRESVSMNMSSLEKEKIIRRSNSSSLEINAKKLYRLYNSDSVETS